MVKKVTFFMPLKTQAGEYREYIGQVAKACEGRGIKCELLEADFLNPKPFLEKLFAEKPDYTFSFNGLLPDAQGRFFCEMTKIPHIACLMGAPYQFFPLAGSPLTTVACADLFFCDFFKAVKMEKTCFFPWGVDKSIAFEKEEERPFSIAASLHLIDFEKEREKWKAKYSQAVCSAMDEAAEEVLSGGKIALSQALADALERKGREKGSLKLEKLSFPEILDDLDRHIEAKGAFLAVAKAGTELHLFADEGLWKRYLGKSGDHVIFHPPFSSYKEMEAAYKKSRIVLNCTPNFKHGPPAAVLLALACGAFPVTDENAYLRDHFEEGKEVAFFRQEGIGRIADPYLSDEARRMAAVEKGRKKVMEKHTWENSVDRLLSSLSEKA